MLAEVLPNPGKQVGEVTSVAVEQSGQERVSLLCVHSQPPAVQSQKHVGGEEGHSLVPVHERVIDDQRLE